MGAETADVMEYGPNSGQVEAYLQQVAGLDADDWASLALGLRDTTGASGAVAIAIDKARSRARKRGLLGDADAAVREANRSTDATLDASAGLREAIDRSPARVGPHDPSLGAAIRDVGATALRTAATSAATLLVLRPLLDDDEFTKAWPMPIVDPRNLPRHVHIPRVGAVG